VDGLKGLLEAIESVFLHYYRVSLSIELRFIVPITDFPRRLIFAYNPNVQTNPAPVTLLAPEKRFAFRIGFSRTL
jgi:hypothetical protein